MSVFGNYNDLSNQIIREGQEISIGFQRNSDGTGTITWNIPPPANGCTAETQAYDGIVITVSEQPANYITTSPKNQVFYNADNTLNLTSNLGDKLDSAFVIGAFYHDRKTTSLTVTDVDAQKWYYISGYAVDNVGTYHREGVHAYSLPTGISEGTETDYSAYQDIIIIPKDGSQAVSGSTTTGLDVTKTYPLTVKIDGTEYNLSIAGSASSTYTNLVNAINDALELLGNDYTSSADAPNTGKYFLDGNSLYKWDGSRNIIQPLITFNQNPANHPQGSFWLNPTTSIISMYETGGWNSLPMISLENKPNEPYCGQIWFTGSEAYEWDGDHWVKLCLYVQTRNPQLAPVLNCNTYWFDKTSGILAKWNDGEWAEVLAIISSQDPNTLSTGNFWYNETTGKMMRYSAGEWNDVSPIRYDTTTPTNPAPNVYWFNPTTQIFSKRDSANTTWIPYEFTMYPTDPMERKSNDLWWNQNSSIDTLYVWDIVNSEWKPIDNFYQTDYDPSLPPELPSCVVWYNPTDGILKYIIKSGCTDKNFIFSLTDPTNPVVNMVWFDTVNKLWYQWDGADWVTIHPLISTFDPFNLVIGYFWFNPDANELKEWNGTTWDDIEYSITSWKPAIGTKWYNTITNTLLVWNGVAWVTADPIAFVSLKYIKSNEIFYNGRAYLRFQTSVKGCGHSIEVIPASDALFSLLVQSVIYTDPVDGNNGVDIGPSYLQLGVGTDGSPDERRAVHDYVRQFLGYPTLQVELFKSQLDHAIDTALLLIRKYSGFAYSRNFFFLDLKPNQQIYTLSNKCVGFNKIVSIKEITRMRAGWLRTAFGGNDLFGVAALQQLYRIGTFDMLSFHLMSSYVKELEQLFATRIMYNWEEKSRQLRLFQNIQSYERVLVDALIERTEQDLLTNRETALWIKKWVLAEAKSILGQTRGKYVNLAGPNGSTSLNAQDLLSQATDEKEKLKEELLDPAMQNYNGIGASVDIAIG